MKMLSPKVCPAALIATACLAMLPAGAASNEPSATDRRPFDYAFEFASAIHNDDKDRAKAQAAVVRDLIQAGQLDQASERLESIEGWRQAVALADLAKALADAGRSDDARAQIREARRARAAITDWHVSRVDAGIAEAMAALGEVEASRAMTEQLTASDRVQYIGTSTTTMVDAFTSGGDFDAAMEYLANLDTSEGFDLEWWQLRGYLEVGRAETFSREQRLQALDSARELVDAAPAGRMTSSLEEIAGAYHALGEQERAVEAMTVASELVEKVPDHYPVKSAELANLARRWSKLGETDRASSLLHEAESVVRYNQPIEQPISYAWIACSYLMIDAREEALRLYDLALTVAEGLVNPRPRALAFVAITRSMGQHGLEVPDAVRSRLDAALDALEPSEVASTTATEGSAGEKAVRGPTGDGSVRPN